MTGGNDPALRIVIRIAATAAAAASHPASTIRLAFRRIRRCTFERNATMASCCAGSRATTPRMRSLSLAGRAALVIQEPLAVRSAGSLRRLARGAKQPVARIGRRWRRGAQERVRAGRLRRGGAEKRRVRQRDGDVLLEEREAAPGLLRDRRRRNPEAVAVRETPYDRQRLRVADAGQRLENRKAEAKSRFTARAHRPSAGQDVPQADALVGGQHPCVVLRQVRQQRNKACDDLVPLPDKQRSAAHIQQRADGVDTRCADDPADVTARLDDRRAPPPYGQPYQRGDYSEGQRGRKE